MKTGKLLVPPILHLPPFTRVSAVKVFHEPHDILPAHAKSILFKKRPASRFETGTDVCLNSV